jgi:single-strand DNA-binding protein
MAKTLNRVQLIGRLGADPELRYTQSGMPVVTFNLATNRQWPGKDGSLQEETEWHTIVAWDKLAQVCADYLAKGRLIYIEGRLRTRSWERNDQKQYKTEIVASDMLILDQKPGSAASVEEQQPEPASALVGAGARRSAPGPARAPSSARSTAADDIDLDDIPF